MIDHPKPLQVEESKNHKETTNSKIRMSICESCSKYNKTFKLCMDCGCYLPLKTRLTSASCPQNKWNT